MFIIIKINARRDGKILPWNIIGEHATMIPTRRCINLRFDSADNQPSFSETSLPKTQLKIIMRRAKNVHHSFSNGIHSGNVINKLIVWTCKWQ